MSTLIISAHTKDGWEYGRLYRLPAAISHVCLVHHGTSLIEYFYHEAVKQAPPGEKVGEELFRYPGPRPKTKEEAIIFLADSVEAASRTLGDPTPHRLENLIHEIVMKRLLDHQLDESGLNLRELEQIEESFARLLVGIFHGRIKYPTVATAEEGFRRMHLEDPHQFRSS